MPISQLLREFDEGVELARKEYDLSRDQSSRNSFGETLASFCFYDAGHLNSNEHREKPLYQRLDAKTDEPFLWKHLNKTLGRILRGEPDIKEHYAGFATLFTLERAADFTNLRPRYFSMAIDIDLHAPGFDKGLPLSRWQFDQNDKSRPLPLTAVCLNRTGNSDFKTRPVIFHWKPKDAVVEGWGVPPEGLTSWAHVYVSANIPFHPQTGMPTSCDWTLDFAEVRVVDNEGVLDKSEVLRRLFRFSEEAEYEEADSAIENMLLNRLAWTVTYFAYGCSCLEKRIQKDAHSPIDHLAIVCAPASFDAVVSAALYVPLFFSPRSEALPPAALKTLYLARSLGLPLEKLKDIQRGQSLTKDQQAHVTSATIDSIVKDIERLPQQTQESMGGYLLARIHLLRATINIYREKSSTIDLGAFPGPWSNSDCPLNVYTEIGLQLGLSRAQDGPELEPLVRNYGALLNEPNYQPGKQGFLNAKEKCFDPVPQTDSGVHPILKHSNFALLVLLALKQAVYHTIRASFKIDSSAFSRIRIAISKGADNAFTVCVIYNPAIPGEEERVSKDAVQLQVIAASVSGIGQKGCQYSVTGPHFEHNTNLWRTSITVRPYDYY